uniref:Uncharacterized protein n=1 Tax=Steinernema glaseri TaxID=37863 RepID=A0A1I7ZTZ7_9BILA
MSVGRKQHEAFPKQQQGSSDDVVTGRKSDYTRRQTPKDIMMAVRWRSISSFVKFGWRACSNTPIDLHNNCFSLRTLLRPRWLATITGDPLKRGLPSGRATSQSERLQTSYADSREGEGKDRQERKVLLNPQT